MEPRRRLPQNGPRDRQEAPARGGTAGRIGTSASTAVCQNVFEFSALEAIYEIVSALSPSLARSRLDRLVHLARNGAYFALTADPTFHLLQSFDSVDGCPRLLAALRQGIPVACTC